MKRNSIITTIAGAAFLAVSPAIADQHDRSGDSSIHHPVTVGDCKGATLWDYHGNKIGEIEDVLLVPNDGAIVIIDTSILENDRKIAVPWSVVNVQTKKTDSSEVIYSLDTTKKKLAAAPAYNGKPETMAGEVRACCTYWEREKTPVSSSIDRAADSVTRAADELERAVDKK